MYDSALMSSCSCTLHNVTRPPTETAAQKRHSLQYELWNSEVEFRAPAVRSDCPWASSRTRRPPTTDCLKLQGLRGTSWRHDDASAATSRRPATERWVSDQQGWWLTGRRTWHPGWWGALTGQCLWTNSCHCLVTSQPVDCRWAALLLSFFSIHTHDSLHARTHRHSSLRRYVARISSAIPRCSLRVSKQSPQSTIFLNSTTVVHSLFLD